jgi:hypothetical protein
MAQDMVQHRLAARPSSNTDDLDIFDAWPHRPTASCRLTVGTSTVTEITELTILGVDPR